VPHSSKSIDPEAQGSHRFFWVLVSDLSESVRLNCWLSISASIEALEEAPVEELRTLA